MFKLRADWQSALPEESTKPQPEEKLRAWWSHRQALDGRLLGSAPAEILHSPDVAGLLDPADLAKEFLTREGAGAAVVDLPSHAIFDRGRLVGLSEYDPSTESIAWTAFAPKNKDLEKAVARTEEYVRTQLGYARSFSLDSPKSRAPRIEALRKAAPNLLTTYSDPGPQS